MTFRYLVLLLFYLRAHSVRSDCTVPEHPDGNVEPDAGSRVPTGAVVRYSCDDASQSMDLEDYYYYESYDSEEPFDYSIDYRRNTIEKTCRSDGEWMPALDVPPCTLHDPSLPAAVPDVTCTLKTPTHGKLVPNDTNVFSVGEKVGVQCDEGYGHVGPRWRSCDASRGWEPPGNSTCEKIYCPLPMLEHGAWEPAGNVYLPGEAVTFYCYDDYELAGTRTMECTTHYGWNSTDIPVCLPPYGASSRRGHDDDDGDNDKECLEPGISPGATVLKKEDGYRKYVCDGLLHMVGSAEIWCDRTTGTWSWRPPYCRTKFCFDTIPELSYRIRRRMEELTSEGAVGAENEVGQQHHRRKRAFTDVRVDGKPLTLYLVMDQSGSISDEDFEYSILFMNELISRLTIRDLNEAGTLTLNGARIGLTGFAKTAKNYFFPFQKEFTAERMTEIINNDLKHLYNATNISDGLKKVEDAIMLGQAQNDPYWKGHLDKSNKAIIIITDGLYTDGGDPTEIAERLREEHGYSIYVIGVADTTDGKELLRFVDPDKKFDDVYFLHEHVGYLHLVENMIANDYKFSDCGLSKATPCDQEKAHILGGNKTDLELFPWSVDIYITKSDETSHIVAGTKSLTEFPLGQGVLIGRSWVLTAAHNLYDKVTKKKLALSQFVLQFGGGGTRMWRTVRKDFEDYEYKDTYGAGIRDIALLRLHAPVTFGRSIRPICLPEPLADFAQTFTPNLTDAYAMEKLGYIAGKAGGDKFKSACVPIIACNETHPRVKDKKADPLFCAGIQGLIDSSSTVDTEKGDSGSAFMRLLPNTNEADKLFPNRTEQKGYVDKRYVAVGLTSFNAIDEDIRKTHAGLGAYVNVTHWMNWIKKTIKEDTEATKEGKN